MKIAAVCCTYLRPVQLGYMVRCFELQDYDDRELVILDDAGQYDNQQGDRWRLISTDRRFSTLGEKRNAAAGMVSDDVEALAVWDDDDLYLPWALRASVEALQHADWSRPGLVLPPQPDGSLRQHQTGGLFHGGWAHRRDSFQKAGGYPAMDNGEDQTLAGRLLRQGTNETDPMQWGFKPFYIYPWATDATWHLSGMGAEGYRQLGAITAVRTVLEIADPPDIDLRTPRILPGIRPRMF